MTTERITSELSCKFPFMSHVFMIDIFRSAEQEFWSLEVVNDQGISVEWYRPFTSDKEALQAAMTMIQTEGNVAFFEDRASHGLMLH
ncbi:hypothetical protein [Magnetospira sp. QH-2]|uniref:hypothetical protein n=1 Tax=Magnetospira sp. (strain QH-2) TaxID=1288970 RepID=UPI0003E81493|nr:hypothetical protein [Magnetospira sp. QH-2]CCQ73912.1 Protein of unknown function [Magnetospira sp. QH-2]